MTKYRFDSASLCVGFKGIAYFDALEIDLEEVAVFSCDWTSLGKKINMMMMMTYLFLESLLIVPLLYHSRYITVEVWKLLKKCSCLHRHLVLVS